MTRIAKNSVQETYAALAAATLILFLLALQNIPRVEAQTAQTNCVAVSSSVSLGSRGEEVVRLQKLLIQKGLLGADSATGYFGPATRTAVQKFQISQSIVASGNEATTGFGAAGLRTRAALNGNCAPATSTKTTAAPVVSCTRLDFPLRTVPQGTLNMPWTFPLISTKSDATITTEGLPRGVALVHTKTLSTSSPAAVTHEWVLTGTTTEAGTYTIIVNGTNACSRAGTSIQFTVSSSSPSVSRAEPSASCVPPVLSIGTPSPMQIGTLWSLPLLISTSTTNVPEILATGLPPGIEVKDIKTVIAGTSTQMHTFVLTGTPTKTGTSVASITARNMCGMTGVTITMPVSAAAPAVTMCPNAPATPVCASGAQISLGLDSNGCSLGYRCEQPGLSCPIFSPPVCSPKQRLVSGGVGKDGCSAAPRCEPSTPNSLFSASPLSGMRPLTVLFSSMVGGGLYQAPAPIFRINFGDGAFTEAAACYAPADSCISPGTNSHTYNGAGVYTATLEMYTGSHCSLVQSGNPKCTSIDAVTNLGTVTISVQ